VQPLDSTLPSRLIPHRATIERYRDALNSQGKTRDYSALVAWLSTFYAYQLEWILEPARKAVVNKSRQIGISHSTAAVGLLWGVFHGEHTTIISRGQLESSEVLEMAATHRRVLEELGCSLAAKDRRDSARSVDFVSGGRMLALPSSGGRGFAGNLFLDEFAYHDHPDKVWDATMPSTSLGNFRARVASTPNGVGNKFHLLCTDAKAGSGWKHHEIPLQRALDDGFRVDMVELWTNALNDPRLFSQLYECSFLDGALQYIPTELVTDSLAEDLGTSGAGNLYGGLDIGKEVDLSVLYTVRRVGKVCWTHSVEVMKRTDSDELEAMVDRAFKSGVTKLAVDATGMGTFPADRMRKKHGHYRVSPVVFTLQKKAELATRLYTAFAERGIKLASADHCLQQSNPPPGIALAIRNDVCSIQRIVTSSNNVTYDAPRTREGHADRAWALALALEAAAGEQPRGFVPS